MPNPCKVCGKEDSKKCGQCHRVYYCSVQCQKKDWKSHKATCSPRQPAETQNPLLRVRDKPMQDKTQAKPVFGEPFTLEKFIPHVEKIKENTKKCALSWVGLRKAGKMDVDTSLATCFCFFTSKGWVREHMMCMEAPPPLHILQQIIDQFKAHAFSIFVEMRYRNPHTMAVMKEGVLLQVNARGYDKKFFFDQTRKGRSATGVLLSVDDPEECHISLFDSFGLTFH